MADYEIATLAGGCFWCLEAVFETLRGVVKVQSGYTGGDTIEPTYQQVCTGDTGHAEAVQVTFDPGVISYQQLLEIFFTIHDPTTPNRQGADTGTQYRSAIFYANESQRETAEQTITALESKHFWTAPIVTELKPIGPFYAAETYHDRYYANNSHTGYCQMVVAPKVRKARAAFGALYQKPE